MRKPRGSVVGAFLKKNKRSDKSGKGASSTLRIQEMDTNLSAEEFTFIALPSSLNAGAVLLVAKTEYRPGRGEKAGALAKTASGTGVERSFGAGVEFTASDSFACVFEVVCSWRSQTKAKHAAAATPM